MSRHGKLKLNPVFNPEPSTYLFGWKNLAKVWIYGMNMKFVVKKLGFRKMLNYKTCRNHVCHRRLFIIEFLLSGKVFLLGGDLDSS